MSEYLAPFAPGGEAAIDSAICERLLAVSLAQGGDYADLYFEHEATSSLLLEEGIIRTGSAGVSCGARASTLATFFCR